MLLNIMVLLLIMILLARIVGEVFERIGFPPIIGEVLIGVALGPCLIGLIVPTNDIDMFQQLTGIAQLALFFLIVDVGLALSVEDIMKSLKMCYPVAILSFAIPYSLGFVVGYWFLGHFVESLFVGLIFSLTALPVTIRVLTDLNIVNTKEGHMIISTAIVNDVAAMIVLGLIITIGIPYKDHDIVNFLTIGWTLLKFVIFFAGLFVIYFLTKIKLHPKGHPEGIPALAFLMQNLSKFLRSKEPYFAVTVLFVLLVGGLGVLLGLEFIIGAFFASLFISKEMYEANHFKDVRTSFSSVAAGFLIPLFFIYIGLKFTLGWTDLWLMAVVLIMVYIVTKQFSGFMGAKILNMPGKSSRMIAIGVALPGAMDLIVANIGLEKGLISEDIFSIVVVMVVFVIILSSVLLKLSIGKVSRKAHEVYTVEEGATDGPSPYSAGKPEAKSDVIIDSIYEVEHEKEDKLPQTHGLGEGAYDLLDVLGHDENGDRDEYGPERPGRTIKRKRGK